MKRKRNGKQIREKNKEEEQEQRTEWKRKCIA
jgi:hypothetical protein